MCTLLEGTMDNKTPKIPYVLIMIINIMMMMMMTMMLIAMLMITIRLPLPVSDVHILYLPLPSEHLLQTGIIHNYMERSAIISVITLVGSIRGPMRGHYSLLVCLDYASYRTGPI